MPDDAFQCRASLSSSYPSYPIVPCVEGFTYDMNFTDHFLFSRVPNPSIFFHLEPSPSRSFVLNSFSICIPASTALKDPPAPRALALQSPHAVPFAQGTACLFHAFDVTEQPAQVPTSACQVPRRHPAAMVVWEGRIGT